MTVAVAIATCSIIVHAAAAQVVEEQVVEEQVVEEQVVEEQDEEASELAAAPLYEPRTRQGMSPIKLGLLINAGLEIVIPDLRWEKGDSSGLLVTWPVVGTFWAGEKVGLAVGLEPQYSVPAKAWRGAGFAQLAYFLSDGGLGFYNQTGYLLGQDGDGAFTSLGIGFGAPYAYHFALFGRVGSYDGQTRFEAGIDVQVQWLWVLLKG